MRTLGLILLTGVLLIWQVTAGAEDAIVLKACPYQVVHDGYHLPKRILPTGAIVKVLTTHGAKADVATSSGDTVSVRLVNLRLVQGAPSPAPVTIQLPAFATPAPPAPAVSPAPSPVKTVEAKPARPNETDRRAASVRCSHLLKNGAQCSRMTTSPNGLCWQHGGD